MSSQISLKPPPLPEAIIELYEVVSTGSNLDQIAISGLLNPTEEDDEYIMALGEDAILQEVIIELLEIEKSGI